MSVKISFGANPRVFLKRMIDKHQDAYTARCPQTLKDSGIPDSDEQVTVMIDPAKPTYSFRGTLRNWRMVVSETASVWQNILPLFGPWQSEVAYDGIWLLDDTGKIELFELINFPFVHKNASGDRKVLYAPDDRGVCAAGYWTPKAVPVEKMELWIGIFLKAGACAYVGGANFLLAYIVSASDPSQRGWFRMDTAEVGPSGGIEGSVGIVAVPGLTALAGLNNHIQSEMDWALTLGLGWGEWIEDAGKLAKLPLDKLMQAVLANHDGILGVVKSINGAVAFDPDSISVWAVDLLGEGAMVKLTWALSRCVAPVDPFPSSSTSSSGGGGDVHYYVK